MVDLLPDGEVHAGGLRDEDRRQRQVERRAVEVEAVAERQDEGDDRRGTPSASIVSMARGSAASDEAVEKAMSAGSLTARKKCAQRNAREQRHGQQHGDEEDDERAVERADQRRQVPQDAEAAVPTV